MRRCILPITMLCGFTFVASPANAAVSMSLSSPSNLSALTVGQKVEIDVNLAGLPSPNSTDFIFNLNTRILFPTSLFTPIPDPTAPSGLTAQVLPGSVFNNNVQGPLQIANFNYQGGKPDGLPDSSLTAGAATGIFSQFPNTNSGAIGLNGLYYSFMIQAKAAGTGSIGIDPNPSANQFAANETGFNYALLNFTIPSLSFTITQAAVPEPSSIAMAALGLAILGGWTHARRRSAG